MTDFDSTYNYNKNKYNPHIPPLKNKLKRAGIFPYLFIEKKKIKKWNKKAGFIDFTSLSTKLTLNREFKEQFDKLFLDHLFQISKHLDEILKNGWKLKFISIWEYNVMVNFKDFYDKFYQVIKEEEILKEDFLRLERAYVKISYRGSYSDTIISVFVRYLKRYNKFYEDSQEKYDNILARLELFFKIDPSVSSLRELILTYNIVKYRVGYKWGDVFPPLGHDIVQNEWYNCSKEVFENMFGYYKSLKKTIKELKVENEELLRFKNNCNIDKSKTPPILMEYYEELGHSWDKDKSNYHLMFLFLAEGIIKDLDSLIFKSWYLLKENEVEVHQRLISDNELPQLHRNLDREFKMAFNYFDADTSVGISVDVFKKLDSPELATNSTKQKKMLICFTEILKIIFEISQILLSYGDVAIETNYANFPYLKYMLNAPKLWTGKPVFALFNYNIELLWTFCSFFRHNTFDNLEHRLIEISKTLNNLTEEKKRIDTYNIIDNAINPKTTPQDPKSDK
ncbi:MAG: hypothetical protein OCD02_14400 [Spirochaetaceae bacterium]